MSWSQPLSPCLMSLVEKVGLRRTSQSARLTDKTSDAKVAISEQGPFHYADVSVTCDPRDRAARESICYPCLVAEVLSPSKEAVDSPETLRERGEKFRQYRRIETLQAYLLIDPNKPSLECYQLNERNNWELVHFFMDEFKSEDCEVNLTTLGLKFPLSLLYEDVELEEIEPVSE